MINYREILPDEDISWLREVILREEDQRELCTSSGIHDPGEALAQCVEESKDFTVGAFDVQGKLLMLFGLTPWTVVGTVGIPWMVATKEVLQYKLRLLRAGIKIVEGMLSKYPVLYNIVDSRNEVHIEWLKWMGFTFFDSNYEIINDIPFLPFYKQRGEQCVIP